MNDETNDETGPMNKRDAKLAAALLEYRIEAIARGLTEEQMRAEILKVAAAVREDRAGERRSSFKIVHGEKKSDDD
jgi:hypothetical protein